MLRPLFVIAVLLVALPVVAVGPVIRAWQQRLHVDVPLAVPMLELAPANPFAVPLDRPPKLVNGTVPDDLDLVGQAVVAAYVDTKGDCLGAVPLEMPFPGMTSPLLTEFASGRFEPAKLGQQATPTWVVVAVTMESSLKKAKVLAESFTIPDPAAPPTPTPPQIVLPPGQLLNLPFSPPSALREPAIPKRIKIRVSGRDFEVPIRVLLHITADGRCDRYIPLELFSGFDLWLASYLSTWNLQPAVYQGQAVESWAVYTARLQVELGTMASQTFAVVRDRSYDPQALIPTP